MPDPTQREPIARGRAAFVPLSTGLMTPVRRRAIRDGLTIVGFLGVAFLFVKTVIEGGGADTRAFWGIHLDSLYGGLQWLQNGAHIYSPAFYEALLPLSFLTWPVFVAVWAAIALACLVWIVRPGPWLGVAVLWVGIVGEIQGGNIHMLMAAAIVAGFRYPEAWSLLLLTKVVPGIGVLWFPLRGDWRGFTRAIGATVAIAAVSFVVAPALWFDWIRLLLGLTHYASQGATTLFGVPLLPRVAIALVVLAWGARTNRAWVLPIVAVLASPLVNVAPSMLVACIPLARERRWATAGRRLRVNAHVEREAGQGIVEYGIILGLMAIVAALALVFFGDQIRAIISVFAK